MKFFDKIKDLFTDEINEDGEEIIEIKEEKKGKKIPTIMREENKNEQEKNISDIDLFKNFENIQLDNVNTNTNTATNSGGNFRFPISFEENDLLDEKILSNQNVMYRENKEVEKVSASQPELYSKKINKEEKVTFFKVSPVISPVYGILDKNYKKDEVQSKPKVSKDITRNNNKVDFESVRKKAYGSLIDDIKDNLSSVKVEEKKEEIIEDNIFQLNQNIEEITFGEMENSFEDFGITFENIKNKKVKNEDDNIKIVSFDEKEPVAEKIEINENFIKSNKQEDDFEETKEEDIFNLIDSMMKKEEEENND